MALGNQMVSGRVMHSGSDVATAERAPIGNILNEALHAALGLEESIDRIHASVVTKVLAPAKANESGGPMSIADVAMELNSTLARIRSLADSLTREFVS